ncbi:MAG: LysM peptidoglycan-binding domain-containing protein [Proteobacteria bacterium]|nr:MAG: LysM peptidoglycan-binding domain-containing protein [Pseudomonadota bacterium]
MTRRVFTGALSKEIAKAEGQADVRERVTLLHQAAKGMLDLIRDGLIRDGAVRLHQFGTFRLKAVAARKGINPRTGAPLVIAAHRRVLFTPAKALLDRIEPIHPIPVPLPVAEAEAVPKAIASATAPPIRPAARAPEPDAGRVIGAPPPEAPAARQQPERRWMAAAALLAAVAVLVILLLPSKDERVTTRVVDTEKSVAPPLLPDTATEPGATTSMQALTAPRPMENDTASSGEMPATEPPASVATTEEPPPPLAAPLEHQPDTAAPIRGEARVSTPAEPDTWQTHRPDALAREMGEALPESGQPIASTTPPVEPVLNAAGADLSTAATTTTIDTPERSPIAQVPTSTSGALQPFFSAITYSVSTGDSLWRLSDRHYEEPILWPHIYRANHPRVDNPNLIYIGDPLTLPELQGAPSELSAQDRQRIAEGYYLVYQFYEAQRHPDAIYALIGARWFDPAVYERHRNDLSRQRLRIMELSPLHGDSVPRLLAATFNRPNR